MRNHINNLTYGASPEIFKRAKFLKEEMTPAEKILLNELRDSKPDGFKFRRQHPIGKFIADFYCHQGKLIIELDGSIHNSEEAKERDPSRTNELENFDLTVIRFQNEDIFKKLDTVLAQIRFSLVTKSLSEREGKRLSPQGEGFRIR